ncbi:SPW repeat domain-containing protein [Flavobacterium foetidum]|uniref:SPW repeat domain-containing protein n=1 Tax=Flavobacterium foetidum TaxID=2026681 RepID=UPI001074DA78|nr:SPW repeat protein [Flavobacterium foetidum]KAF2510563.1 hypothetical protein E0W73_17720 [Flavobacterium foetidum]
MKPIDTKTHGYMDYIMGIFLIASPSLFELDHNRIESTIFYVLGVSAILYSLLTNYELGFMKLIPMKFHLILDFLSGALLAASPWLFGFSETVYGPHLVLGIIEIGASLLTSAKPMKQVV